MIDTLEHGPLDPDAYKHQARIPQALHYARPVRFEGKECFVQAAPARLAGGRVEMEVFLMGCPTPIDSTKIEFITAALAQQNPEEGVSQ